MARQEDRWRQTCYRRAGAGRHRTGPVRLLFVSHLQQLKRVRDQNPIRTARRKTLRVDRLGNNASCLFCGYACLESLTKVSRQWLEARGISKCRIDRLLEVHHIVGEA